MTQPEATGNSNVCGARLRNGQLCAAAPVVNRKRCHAHGGAPRSGAPPGNLNALTHGAYVGGKTRMTKLARRRARKLNAFERNRTRRLQHDATAYAQSGVRPANPACEALASFWEGEKMRALLEQVRKQLEQGLEASFASEPLIVDMNWAMRDVLFCLSRRPRYCESNSRLADMICEVFFYLDDGQWQPKWSVSSNAADFYINWRNYCAELYEWCCPDPGFEKKPRWRHSHAAATDKSTIDMLQAQLAEFQRLAERLVTGASVD